MKNHEQQPWRNEARFQPPKPSGWRYPQSLEEKLLRFMNENAARALGWLN